MLVRDATDYLKDNGYKYERGSDPSWKVHYLYKRMDCTDCQCNERPPNLGFEIHELPEGDFMSVKIRGEAINGQWVDVGYYSMDVDMVKEVSTLEFTITKMWECAN